MCDGIANGDEAEPVNEGKNIGGVELILYQAIVYFSGINF